MAAAGNGNIPQLMSLALTLQQGGRLSDAEVIYRKVLKVDPEFPEALHFLGLTRHQRGNSADGIRMMRRAVRLQPANAMFHNNIGIVLKATGAVDRAIEYYREAVRLQPGYAEAWFNLGVACQDLFQLVNAVNAYRKAVELRPRYERALVNLAGALKEIGRASDAIKACEQALQANPKSREAIKLLSDACIDLGLYEYAERRLQDALKESPDDAPLLLSLGEVLSSAGRHDQAREACARICDLGRDAASITGAGEVYRSLGEQAAAVSCFERALEITPGYASAIFGLSTVTRFSVNDNARLSNFSQSAANENLPSDERVKLHFALGKAYDDMGDFDKAFAHYCSGNSIRRQQIDFSHARHSAYIDEIIHTFSADAVDRGIAAQWHDSDRPLFIVGMPRSGTTLVDQILSSHPSVQSAGELLHIGRLTRTLQDRLGAAVPYPACVAQLDREVGRRLAEEYLASMPTPPDGVRHVTDKMPHNFLHTGLLAMMFPRGHIIHCKRDPVDVCLSVFFQLFNRTHSYSFDLRDIAFYYREYRRVMQHWQSILGDRLFEIDYSAIVINQEHESRRLLKFCGLPWDESTLRFHETAGTVRTASQWQIRQPVYRSSLQRWKNYRSHIQWLIDDLQ
jgi:tetratricopeptide (TPR) repeat protein